MDGSFWRSEPAAELRGLAKICSPLFLLPLVEFEEVGLGHVDLAPHLASSRHGLALQFLRYVLERADIGGDVLTFGAVAAGGGGDQFAILVTQRHRQAVDLRLGAERKLVVLAELEEAADACNEIDDVLVLHGVVEREHRHRVAHFLEAARRRGADPDRQRFQRAQVGKACLDGVVAFAQRIVLGVGDDRRVLLVVALVVLGDFACQPIVLGLRLLGGQQIDRSFVGFDFGFGHIVS